MREHATARLKSWAKTLKREVAAIGIAARDPRTPRLARIVALATVAYALSPIDLIPDFIPILGQVDDLILVPLGLWLALRLIPDDALRDARARALAGDRLTRSSYAIAFIVAIWIAAVIVVVRLAL